MITNPIVTDLITLLNKICQLKEAGMDIVQENCYTDLSFIWRNRETGKIIDTVKLSRVKAITHLRTADPRVDCLIDFVVGGDSFTARDNIHKLEKLKAFW